ncbi:MAG: lipoyl synthase [Bacteroidales bacterium]|nr:lipoyl synthase [Bacteroidales bacterium]
MNKDVETKKKRRLPDWLKAPLPHGKEYSKVKRLIEEHDLHTICTSGNCPNRGECWSAGTASFMILGEKCTRNCRFCGVLNELPGAVDWKEPRRLAETIRKLQLKHAVVTSVARDDLKDGGAAFWAKTIGMIKELNPETTMEVLIPDMNGKREHLQKIIDAQPEVISHNMETVRRLTPKIRNLARYDRSLKVIRIVSESGLVAKSGIMVGLGETTGEVLELMDDLAEAGCDVLTIGQYLQPDSHLEQVKEYVRPEVYDFYREEGLKRGIGHVESGPLVRSSYHAEKHVNVKKTVNP